MRTSWIFRSFLAILLALTLAACGSKISQANFEKIQDNMTMEQVTAILGEPTTTNNAALPGISAADVSWKSEEGTISIQFLNGKVKMKTFTK
jgi:hypothetical protein